LTCRGPDLVCGRPAQAGTAEAFGHDAKVDAVTTACQDEDRLVIGHEHQAVRNCADLAPDRCCGVGGGARRSRQFSDSPGCARSAKQVLYAISACVHSLTVAFDLAGGATPGGWREG
jgi:hypothetical protein